MARSSYKYHTIAETFLAICQQENPWIPPGNFLNDWRRFAVDHKQALIETPLAPATTPDARRWAAFCAAMVEGLCQQEYMPVPLWTQQKDYILPDPWFYYENWESRAWLLATTPAPFKARNIFVGDKMFLTKWDLKNAPPSSHQWTAQEMGLA